MELDVYQPTFLIEIEGRRLSKDITHEITSFVFEDNEEELDVMEVSITDRYLQFVDDPLFQEGNEIVARFGYADDLSLKKVAVIKEIDYDFPDGGDPTIQLKAYDKGHKLAGKQIQRVWQKPAPGILYSEIAEQIAREHGLTPVVTKTVGRHLRVVQANKSDAQFLKELAAKSRDRDGKGVTGYVFYVQDDELHFHPRGLAARPALVLEYFTDREGVLRSFKPSTQSQSVKGAGTETKAVGVDPRKKKPVEHKANNATTPDRASLGKKTYLVDGSTGEGKFRKQESGKIVPSIGALGVVSRRASAGAGSGQGREPVQERRDEAGRSDGHDHRHPELLWQSRTSRSGASAGSSQGPTTALPCGTSSRTATRASSSSSAMLSARAREARRPRSRASRTSRKLRDTRSGRRPSRRSARRMPSDQRRRGQ